MVDICMGIFITSVLPMYLLKYLSMYITPAAISWCWRVVCNGRSSESAVRQANMPKERLEKYMLAEKVTEQLEALNSRRQYWGRGVMIDQGASVA